MVVVGGRWRGMRRRRTAASSTSALVVLSQRDARNRQQNRQRKGSVQGALENPGRTHHPLQISNVIRSVSNHRPDALLRTLHCVNKRKKPSCFELSPGQGTPPCVSLAPASTSFVLRGTTRVVREHSPHTIGMSIGSRRDPKANNRRTHDSFCRLPAQCVVRLTRPQAGFIAGELTGAPLVLTRILTPVTTGQ
jgi:hypothetical protein